MAVPVSMSIPVAMTMAVPVPVTFAVGVQLPVSVPVAMAVPVTVPAGGGSEEAKEGGEKKNKKNELKETKTIGLIDCVFGVSLSVCLCLYTHIDSTDAIEKGN